MIRTASLLALALTQLLLAQPVSAQAVPERAPASAGEALPVQSERALAFGYRVVTRTFIKSRDMRGGVEEQHVVYANDAELCECNPLGVFISPDGQFALYRDQSNLMLYHTPDGRRTNLGLLLGEPQTAQWDLAGNRVAVTAKINNHVRDFIATSTYSLSPGSP